MTTPTNRRGDCHACLTVIHYTCARCYTDLGSSLSRRVDVSLGWDVPAMYEAGGEYLCERCFLKRLGERGT
jgi:hypothetical protein